MNCTVVSAVVLSTRVRHGLTRAGARPSRPAPDGCASAGIRAPELSYSHGNSFEAFLLDAAARRYASPCASDRLDQRLPAALSAVPETSAPTRSALCRHRLGLHEGRRGPLAPLVSDRARSVDGTASSRRRRTALSRPKQKCGSPAIRSSTPNSFAAERYSDPLRSSRNRNGGLRPGRQDCGCGPLLADLLPPHRVVQPLLRRAARAWRARLDDAAALQHVDPVGVHDRREPVRDQDRDHVLAAPPPRGSSRRSLPRSASRATRSPRRRPAGAAAAAARARSTAAASRRPTP